MVVSIYTEEVGGRVLCFIGTSFGKSIELGRVYRDPETPNTLQKLEESQMPFMYILKCNDGTYYTGSTYNLEKRLLEHASGEGANYTIKRLPVELVYFEKYDRIDVAFNREKQIQKWSHKKKENLINGNIDVLKEESKKVFNKK